MGDEKNGHYLIGKLLLSMPAMGDPRFHRAVIFVCAHDEKGAMGLVINHALPGLRFKNLLDQLKIVSDIEIGMRHNALPVMCGGPVEGSRGFILHSGEFRQADTIRVADSYGITGTVEALRAVAGGKGPEHVLFILGYAGWGAGQLERELQENTWLVSDPDPEVVFHASPEEKWMRAVRKMGFDPAMLSLQTGRA